MIVGPDLVVAVALRGVIPVEAFAAGDVGAEIDRAPPVVPRRRVEVVAAVAPVGERHVVVDRDRVDVVARPQRIEVEVDVVGAVARLVAEILAPVGPIGEPDRGAEHASHIAGEIDQRADEGIVRGAGAERRQAAQLRADQEGIDAARRLAKMGVVED